MDMRGLRATLISLVLIGTSYAQQPRWQQASDSGALLETIKYELNAAKTETDPVKRSNHYFLLNDAAERFAIKLNETIGGVADQSAALERTKTQVDNANRDGAKIVWCEFDSRWTVTPDGYLEYLKLNPTGTYAEEAWWRGKLHQDLTACMDAEGSLDEAKSWVAAYKEFLHRFPKGKHVHEAREELKHWQKELAFFKSTK